MLNLIRLYKSLQPCQQSCEALPSPKEETTAHSIQTLELQLSVLAKQNLVVLVHFRSPQCFSLLYCSVFFHKHQTVLHLCLKIHCSSFSFLYFSAASFILAPRLLRLSSFLLFLIPLQLP